MNLPGWQDAAWADGSWVVGSWGTPVAPEPEVSSQPTAAGGSSKSKHRRRYIMPDGQVVQATTEEAFEILRQYASPVEQKKPKKAGDPKIVMPMIELEKRDVRFIPATDAQADTWKVVLSEKFTYRADPMANLLAIERLNRIRDDEEAIMVLLH